MKFFEFLDKIFSEGYNDVEEYCNINGCNYEDCFDDYDDDDSCYSNDDDDNGWW